MVSIQMSDRKERIIVINCWLNKAHKLQFTEFGELELVEIKNKR
jgi:hypothetical protein